MFLLCTYTYDTDIYIYIYTMYMLSSIICLSSLRHLSASCCSYQRHAPSPSAGNRLDGDGGVGGKAGGWI